MISPAVGIILLVGFLLGGIFAAIALARTTLFGRRMRDYTARVRKLEENFVESRMKLNVLAKKANWEPPEWEPPKIEELARQLVKEVNSFKPRCPHCKFIIVNKPKHCPQCGQQFNIKPTPKVPRILATHLQVVMQNGFGTTFAVLEWQCLECNSYGSSHTKKWKLADLQKRKPFIYVLTCTNECEHEDVGDVIIDPQKLDEGSWAVDVAAHGELSLSDYDPSYRTLTHDGPTHAVIKTSVSP